VLCNPSSMRSRQNDTWTLVPHPLESMLSLANGYITTSSC
jgi:hypothetical protein